MTFKIFKIFNYQEDSVSCTQSIAVAYYKGELPSDTARAYIETVAEAQQICRPIEREVDSNREYIYFSRNGLKATE
ncbi:hypothetical protein GCM10025772_12070 [Ferrimonas gelatinilytica]|uniref:Uncharacterized protein n=1 Tax=Ferrimonas gelatinilytica TaxID=1255257 RepID=A0ABP9S1X4_9GAMM